MRRETNKLPWRLVTSRYETTGADGRRVTMLVLSCGHRTGERKAGQRRARCPRCR
jgi:hypothetical protein